MKTVSHTVTGNNTILVVGHPKGKIVTYAGKTVEDGILHISHKNRGNFANSSERAREAGRKGGRARGKGRQPRTVCDWLHTGWGNRVTVHWPETPSADGMVKCDGHLRGLRLGDHVLIRFASMKIGRLVIRDIRYATNPTDLFFADLEWMDYAQETREECEALDRAHPYKRFA